MQIKARQTPEFLPKKPDSWRVLAKVRGISFQPGTYPHPPRIPPTCILDGLYFIGDEFVGCYIIDTGDGLIMIDCTCNSNYHFNHILHDFDELGLDIQNLRYICITHGHFDHYGQCDRLQALSGARLIMAEAEYLMARNTFRYSYPPINGQPDYFLEDGDSLTVGAVTLYFYITPGHTPASTSIIFKVFDNGVPHTASLFAGCDVSRFMKIPQVIQYIDSAKRWSVLCEEHHADTLLSIHPYVINAKEKIDLIRNINHFGIANPFIIGREGCKLYEDLLIHRGLKGLQNRKLQKKERKKNNERNI